ncbi:MAG: glycosyltransferase family 4 protein, partial [Polyangiaceae bacterium]
PPGDAAQELRRAGFIYHPLKMQRAGVNPWAELGAARDLARLYRRIGPELVHHIALKSVLYGSVVARSLGIPAVGSITGLGYTFIPGGPQRIALREGISLMLRAALASANVHLIFQNPDDRELFIRKKLVRESRTSLIAGSGVDTDRFAFLPEPSSVPRVLIATRMLKDKGVSEAIAAARLLRQRNVQFELVLAGDVDLENPASIAAEQLRAWHAEGIARWLGQSRDIARLLQEAHVACLPSYREGLPLFLAEAASAGRAAVTTDVPGCRSVVLHGRTGLLVPVRDARGLADALQALLSNAELRERMGKAARELALREFAKERVNEAVFDIYCALLASTGDAS